jgi:ABC-2 type transport system ATP-binding protein
MIQIEGLSKYYRQLCAVDNISFNIDRGEILGLLGPNGAGKTTTLRMLTCFLKPTSGNVRVKDFTIDKNALEIKQLMGYLPESAPLYHDMLVYDYLNYIANIRGIGRAEKLTRIKDLVDLCGLKGVMHQPVSELSKGYKQRVGLAHAMMSDPEILVLDEPTSGLDPNQIVEIREIIKRIGKEKTIILSTHILSEAEATCDRIVIINKGKIVADGSTDSLKQSRSRENILNVTLENADTGNLQEAFARIEGIKNIESIDMQNNRTLVKLHCDANLELRHQIYAQIKSTDWILLEFYLETQTLETIFRNLTQES